MKNYTFEINSDWDVVIEVGWYKGESFSLLDLSVFIFNENAFDIFLLKITKLVFNVYLKKEF